MAMFFLLTRSSKTNTITTLTPSRRVTIVWPWIFELSCFMKYQVNISTRSSRKSETEPWKFLEEIFPRHLWLQVSEWKMTIWRLSQLPVSQRVNLNLQEKRELWYHHKKNYHGRQILHQSRRFLFDMRCFTDWKDAYYIKK